MFHSIRGKVMPVAAQRIRLSTRYGIEWSLACSAQSIIYWREYAEGDGSDEQTVYTHLVIRDDQVHLYGYHSELERELFLRLIKVSGIGPSVAIHILSAMSVDTIRRAISDGDYALLSTAPKLGPKNAQKIILALKGNIQFVPATAEGAGDALVVSLVNMGYERARVIGVIAELRKEYVADGLSPSEYENKIFEQAVRRLI